MQKKKSLFNLICFAIFLLNYFFEKILFQVFPTSLCGPQNALKRPFLRPISSKKGKRKVFKESEFIDGKKILLEKKIFPQSKSLSFEKLPIPKWETVLKPPNPITLAPPPKKFPKFFVWGWEKTSKEKNWRRNFFPFQKTRRLNLKTAPKKKFFPAHWGMGKKKTGFFFKNDKKGFFPHWDSLGKETIINAYQPPPGL